LRYEGFLGPFPFRELNIIEIPDYGWGQAPPGTLFITQEAFNPIMDEANQLFSGGVNQRFAHEIAHQYWGTVVKSPSREEQWLEEAFAEYCAAQHTVMSRVPTRVMSMFPSPEFWTETWSMTTL
jgi:hypothetical protein